MCSCLNTDTALLLRSACLCVCSLSVRFMPDSAVDPVELFSSVTFFLKDLFVECFHIQKIMFRFFVVLL